MTLLEGIEQILRYERYKVRSKPDRDRAVVLRLHHTLLRQFRIIALHEGNLERVDHLRDEIEALAREIRDPAISPLVWAETQREFVGYDLERYRKDEAVRHLDDAQQRSTHALTSFRDLTIQSPRIEMTILHAQIELGFRILSPDKAMQLVLKYAELCQKYPNAHCIRQLQRIVKEHSPELRYLQFRREIESAGSHSFILAFSYIEPKLSAP